MGERECSVQRRHQKVIEETPSPFFSRYPMLRKEICDAAVRLCRSIKYSSAGNRATLVLRDCTNTDTPTYRHRRVPRRR